MPSSDPRRRHADVGDDDVGYRLVGGLLERNEAVAVRDCIDVRLGVDELAQALADEVVILADDDPDRYAHDD